VRGTQSWGLFSGGPGHPCRNPCFDDVEFGGVRSLPNHNFPTDLLMFHSVGIIHEKSILYSGNNAFDFVGILFSPDDPASGE
jgi:hypothetical protein